MRIKVVEFAGKKITIREMKIKELTALAEKLQVDFTDLFQAKEVNDVLATVIALLNDKIPEIFPDVEKKDVEEAYPSELESLIGGFIDTNFFGIKKVIIPLLKLNQTQSLPSLKK
jgi:hypothetical protein